jgi:hypothetical protein
MPNLRQIAMEQQGMVKARQIDSNEGGVFPKKASTFEVRLCVCEERRRKAKKGEEVEWYGRLGGRVGGRGVSSVIVLCVRFTVFLLMCPLMR